MAAARVGPADPLPSTSSKTSTTSTTPRSGSAGPWPRSATSSSRIPSAVVVDLLPRGLLQPAQGAASPGRSSTGSRKTRRRSCLKATREERRGRPDRLAAAAVPLRSPRTPRSATTTRRSRSRRRYLEKLAGHARPATSSNAARTTASAASPRAGSSTSTARPAEPSSRRPSRPTRPASNRPGTTSASASAADVPTDDEALAALLAGAIRACSEEVETGHWFEAEADGAVRSPSSATPPTTRSTGSWSASATGRPRGGGSASRSTRSRSGRARHTPVLVRSTEFPSNPNAAVSKQIGELIARGGRRVVVEDSDWRAMLALPRFREQHQADPAFAPGSSEEKPLSRLEVAPHDPRPRPPRRPTPPGRPARRRRRRRPSPTPEPPGASAEAGAGAVDAGPIVVGHDQRPGAAGR